MHADIHLRTNFFTEHLSMPMIIVFILPKHLSNANDEFSISFYNFAEALDILSDVFWILHLR